MRPNPLHRTLALGAIFQAGLLADQLAATGTRDTSAMKPLLEGILSLNSAVVDEVYPRFDDIAPGLRLLRDALTGKQRRDNFRQVGHSLSLIQLGRVASRKKAMQANLRDRLEALVAQKDHFPDVTATEFCHRAAGIYSQTLSTLTYRIQVQGDPDVLRNADNAAVIRALFLAGVRAAFLWHQNGGRRWQLVIQRRQILKDIDQLLA